MLVVVRYRVELRSLRTRGWSGTPVRAGLGGKALYRFYAPSSVEVRLDAAGGKYPLVRAAAGVVADLTRRAELLAVDGCARVITASDFMRSQLHLVHPTARAPQPLDADHVPSS
ncbi:hypothetical protein GCM10027586_12060 [Kineococcus gypseus]|uniref:hypothetical protein n=1 Tax=Kineococcus gypseus TaxID=1637102 RepID=UPI003D7E91C5